MSTSYYWGVMPVGAWGKRKVWPRRFHFRASDAKDECFQANKREEHFKSPRKYMVERFLIEAKGTIHFDLYEHSVIRAPKGKLPTLPQEKPLSS